MIDEVYHINYAILFFTQPKQKELEVNHLIWRNLFKQKDKRGEQFMGKVKELSM